MLKPVLEFIQKMDRRIAFALMATSAFAFFLDRFFYIENVADKIKPYALGIFIFCSSFLLFDIFKAIGERRKRRGSKDAQVAPLMCPDFSEHGILQYSVMCLVV